MKRTSLAVAAVAAALVAAPTAASADTAKTSQLASTQALAEADAACAVPANRDIAVTRTVYRVGTEMKVSDKVMLAGFMAGWVESHMNNLDCGDRDSLGVFQQRPSQGWGTEAQILDVRYAATKFFTEAKRIEPAKPGETAGQLAQRVQRSAFGERYDQARAKAQQLLAEVRPSAVTTADRFHTNNNRDTGVAGGPFPFGTSADEHFVGDWDGDGIDTPGLRQGTKFYISRDARGTSVFTFNYGFTDSDVVVGDWDGDGKDSIGVVSSNSTWYLRNSLSGGNADLTYTYGSDSTVKVAGDWNGDGVDTPGVVSGNTWLLKNSHAGGNADIRFDYGFLGGTKVVGDWNNDGKDTPGVIRDGEWFFKNSLTGGEADLRFTFGRDTDITFVGDWNGDGYDSAGISRNR